MVDTGMEADGESMAIEVGDTLRRSFTEQKHI